MVLLTADTADTPRRWCCTMRLILVFLSTWVVAASAFTPPHSLAPPAPAPPHASRSRVVAKSHVQRSQLETMIKTKQARQRELDDEIKALRQTLGEVCFERVTPPSPYSSFHLTPLRPRTG